MNKISKSEEDEIVNDYLNGMTMHEIALKHRRDDTTVMLHLRKRGVYRRLKYCWTNEDKEWLLTHYNNCSWDEITLRFPHLTKQDIFQLSHKLGIEREQPNRWCEHDVEILTKWYGTLLVEEIKKLLFNQKTKSQIYLKALRMGLSQSREWTASEIEILKEYYPICFVDEVLQMIPRHTRKSIIMRACELKIKNSTTIQSHIKYPKLGNYLRSRNSKWYNKSIQNCSGKCVLTNSDVFEVHHLYSVNTMIDETLRELNLTSKPSDKEYSYDEKEMIFKKFTEIQSRHPLGVCVSKEMHVAFHRTYGYGNNTEEQWNEFVELYNLGCCKYLCNL